MNRNSCLAIVEGEHNGPFVCALEFNFNPLTCTMAAPKVRGLFLRETLETCQRRAKEYGFSFKILPDANPDHDPHPALKVQ